MAEIIVYLGADHRGFSLKETLKKFLREKGCAVEDLGNAVLDPNDDYPDFAARVAEKVSADPQSSRGILVCGSGAGVDIVANKFRGVRSTVGLNPEQIRMARSEDDLNVLSLASDFTGEEDAKRIITIFLETPFSGEERHRRRIGKIAGLEK